MEKRPYIHYKDWPEFVELVRKLGKHFSGPLSPKEKERLNTLQETVLPACNELCNGFNQRGLPHDFDTRVIAYFTTNPAFSEEDRTLFLDAIMGYKPDNSQPLEPLTAHALREIRKTLTAPSDGLKQTINILNNKVNELSGELEEKEIYFKKLISEITFLTASIQNILDNSTDKIERSESIVLESFSQGVPNDKIIEVIKAQNRKTIQYFKEEAEKASQDPLTGLFNRGTLDYRLKILTEECIKSATPLSLLIIDIDHFKRINDTYGHLVGDQAIRFVVDSGINNVLKKYSSAFGARYGGEEFVLIFKGVDLRPCISIAETLRKTIETTPFRFLLDDKNLEHPITISIGVSQLQTNNSEPQKDLLFSADKALYDAKSNGRNRVCSFKSS